ncbi:MAG: hypothetical protein ACXV5P_07265 [Halobacteriota archaeon]
MSEQNDDAAKVNLLYHELGSLMGFQAQQVSNINERIGWLIVFSALNVSTLMVSSFTAFRSNLLEQSGYEWWLSLFALDILVYVLAIVLGYLGQRIGIRYFDAEKHDELPYKELGSRDATYIRNWLLETRYELFHQNERLIILKSRYLNYAYSSLVAAVALLFVVVLTAVIF